MTSVNSVFGLLTAQIAKAHDGPPPHNDTHGPHRSDHGKHDAKHEVKAAAPEAGRGNAQAAIASETLQAIQTLKPGKSEFRSLPPAFAASEWASRFGAAVAGGADIGRAWGAPLENSVKATSYSFSFSMNLRLTSGAVALTGEAQPFSSAVNPGTAASGLTTGVCCQSVTSMQASVSFSYAASAFAASQQGDKSEGNKAVVQTAAFRAVTGQISIGATSTEHPIPVSYGDISQSQQLHAAAPSPNAQASNSFMTASFTMSFRYESSFAWGHYGSAADSEARDRTPSGQRKWLMLRADDMNSINSVFGLSMAQIAKLFAPLHPHHDKHGPKHDAKESAEPTAADAGRAGKSRSIAEDALDVIQRLTSMASGAPSQPPASTSAACTDRLRSAIGGDDIEISQTSTFEGAIKEASYSFSFSVSQSLDSSTGALKHTDYTFELSINNRLMLSGWATGGRGQDVEALQMSLGFSYTESTASAIQAGGASVQTASFRTISGQINIDASFLQQRLPLTFGDNSHRQQLQAVAPSPNVQISSNVMMASGRYESASLWTPSGSTFFSRATETSVSFQTNLQLAWSK